MCIGKIYAPWLRLQRLRCFMQPRHPEVVHADVGPVEYKLAGRIASGGKLGVKLGILNYM